MSRIEVRAAEGRIARVSPNGPFIPNDSYVPVEATNYVRDLIEVQEDLIVNNGAPTYYYGDPDTPGGIVSGPEPIPLLNTASAPAPTVSTATKTTTTATKTTAATSTKET